MLRISDNKYVVVLYLDRLGDMIIEDEVDMSGDLASVFDYVIGQAQYALMDTFNVHPAEFNEFKAGLSMTFDKIKAIDVKYAPMEFIKITIHKRVCVKCGKPCGLAEQYCNGRGQSTKRCTDCGTTEHKHAPTCSYNS